MRLRLADLKALAAYRIFTAGYLLFDIALRWIDAPLVYHPGVLEPVRRELTFSLMRATENLQTLPLLWVAIAICYALFLVGFQTRVFHALSLVGFVSLLNYNNHVLYEGDALVAFGLLWSLFTPTGSKWSLDSIRHPDSAKRVRSWGVAALKVQVLVMYAVSASWKLTNPDHDWTYGTALFYGSRYDCTAWGLAPWIQSLPFPLTRLLTWFILAAWCAAPVILVGRVRTASQRRWGVGCLVFVHALLCSTLYVGAFFWAILPLLLLFLEPSDLGFRRNGNESGTRSEGGWRSTALIALLAYVNFFTLGQAYENLIRSWIGDAGAPLYYGLKPVRLVNLNVALFPPQYWRIHAFTPRFDTTFFFEGITREGRSIDLSPPLISWTRWFTLTSPGRIDWSPQHNGRIYDRLVYNYLWHMKKGGDARDRAVFGEWLRNTYQMKFPGLVLDRIVWHDWMEITEAPGLPQPAGLIKEIAQTWDWTPKAVAK